MAPPTKLYALSFSRALHAEWKKRGIWVTSVCPGPVDTEFFEVSGPLGSPLKKLVLADAFQSRETGTSGFQKKKAGLCVWSLHETGKDLWKTDPHRVGIDNRNGWKKVGVKDK